MTTADERTWPAHGPVLWLGEWCRLYSRRPAWEALNGEVLPYHWKDREQFEQDFHYLDSFYEKTLNSLANQLNTLHCTSYSTRYWRILAGPWLAYFIHILYDRWLSVHAAVIQYPMVETTVLPPGKDPVAPNDMSDFLRMTRGDEWNSRVYAELIETSTSITVNKLCDKQSMAAPDAAMVPLNRRADRQGVRKRIIGIVRALAFRIARMVGRPDDVFINVPYLSKKTLVQVFLRLRQFPVMWDFVPAPYVDEDATQRAWSLNETGGNEFEEYLLAQIPRHLPRFCLEGYGALMKVVENLPWPTRPRVLYTANVIWHDAVSMAYFAEKSERGSRIVYGQHGGVYGTAKFQFARRHESKISDLYLVWGAAGVECPHERKVGITKVDSPCRVEFGRNRRLLLVTLNTPRYSYRLCSETARDFIGDLNDSYSMIEALKPTVQRETLVRLIPVELGWALPQRWRDRYPFLAIDPGYQDIYELMRTSRLVIFNYNQTGFLETMAMRIPSILICDYRKKYPLRSVALPLYQMLERVGICHLTPESAAAHVNRVWDNIDGWWSSSDVQGATTSFCQAYCELEDGLADRIFEQLASAASSFV